ncbi:uncharacterized protein LOC114321173 [Camellia sinensis]|uniref:uncharacterized protein LOC114321173 n=1 Tax=Camellia sinensis TaxID=4442 RepID=UPI001036879E|nr:uncharacterized protein LOC114321173 [Camellia sinensis]
MQSFETKKALADKTREATSLQKTNRNLQSKMKTLADQAEAAVKAKDVAEEKAEATDAIKKVLEAQRKEAEEKTTEAQKELQDTLATKDAELKAADEKGYNKGVADVTADYEKQVKLEIPDDSLLRNTDVLPLPFPSTPSQSDDDFEPEEEALVRKSKEAAGTKSPAQNEQALDLTQDEEGEEVPIDAAPEKATSDVPIADKSLGQALQEIDAELAAKKAAEMSSQQSSEL